MAADESFEEFLREAMRRQKPEAWEAFCRVVDESLREARLSPLSKPGSRDLPIGCDERGYQISDRPKAGPIRDVKS
jgi:hypothetical protein